MQKVASAVAFEAVTPEPELADRFADIVRKSITERQTTGDRQYRVGNGTHLQSLRKQFPAR